MDVDELKERIRFGFLRTSSCTAVQIEKRRREVLLGWLELRRQRRALERDKRIWCGTAPRPLDPERPFCFALDRMKRKWRDADRRSDTFGFPVHRTIGSTRARVSWFELLWAVLDGDEVIRVRHRYYDEPAVLMRESRFRELEKRAFNLPDPGVRVDRRSPASPR